MMMMLQQLVLKSRHLWLYVFFLSNIFVYISKKDVVNRIYERVIHEAKRWRALVVPKELRGMPQDVWHIIVQQVISASFNIGGHFLGNNHFLGMSQAAIFMLSVSCIMQTLSGQPVVSGSDSEHVRFEG